MQDAYFSEKGSVGNWEAIGYSGPGEKKNVSSYASNVFQYYSTGNNWVAKPKTKLNDCTTSHQWELIAANAGTAIDGVYPNFTITNGTSSSQCLALTASWSSLTGSH